MASLKRYLEKKLRLKVNEAKSGWTSVELQVSWLQHDDATQAALASSGPIGGTL